jgi:glucosamine-phosphate N-acetyltransferase
MEKSQMAKIKIRQMYRKDLDNNFLETLSALKPTTLTLDRLKHIHSKRVNIVKTFVAIKDYKVVGTVSLLLEQKFINDGGICGHIEDMSVHKDHQKQGIGKALIEFAVEYARKKKAYKIILDCADDKVGFYMSCGFVIWQNSMRIDL